MRERGDRLRLALEPRERGGAVVRPLGGSTLTRDVAAQLRVAGAVDLAHAAGPQGTENLVRSEPSAGGRGIGGLYWRFMIDD